MNKRLTIKVFGRVQGVYFRGTARKIARNLHLTGYAKNLQDGTVELVAEGDERNLEKFLEWAQRGSFLAKVEGFEYHWDKPTHEFSDFLVVRGGNIIQDQVKAFTNLAKKILLPKGSVVPQHIVIIPDGNRRWAKEHGLPPSIGHRYGFKRLKELIEAGQHLGIKVLTVWGFSTENWKREPAEVEYLFKIFMRALREIEQEADKRGICFRHIGRKDRLPTKLLKMIEHLEKITAKNNKFYVNLGLDYGGRDEILRGVNKLINSGINNGQVDEQTFSNFLDTHGLPDPDLIIRTSGEQRLSGIMPWQGVYSELYFTPLYFPDFDAQALELALIDYSHRQRRFGA